MAKKRSTQPQRRPSIPRLMCEADTKPLVKRAGLSAAAGVGRDITQAELVHALVQVATTHLDEVIRLIRDRDDEADENGEDQ